MKMRVGFDELSKDLERAYSRMTSLEAVDGKSLDVQKTVHVVVDMVNGFVKTGPLSSKEVLSINESVAAFCSACEKANIPNYALCDCHPEGCSEFKTYPVHCVEKTEESELTDELKKAASFRTFPKLSINGWLEDDFRSAIIDGGFDTFIVTGDCTDMCVLQLVLSLKSGLNRINRESRVLVPMELVATCSLPSRMPESAELASFLVMEANGIEPVKNIIF